MKDNILTFLTELKTPCRTTEIAIHFGLSAYQGKILPDDSRKGGKDKTLASKERCQYLMGNEFVTGKYLCLKYKNGQRFSRVVRR